LIVALFESLVRFNHWGIRGERTLIFVIRLRPTRLPHLSLGGAVVDEDRRRADPRGREDCSGLDIEVMIVLDGQVPHPAVVLLRRGAAVGCHDLPARGLKMLIFR
jgi:hypothetical protein